MRILHVRNIANVASTLAKRQREVGHEARILCINEPKYGMDGDFNMRLPREYRLNDVPKRALKITKTLLDSEKYDIYHMHTSGIFPMDLDIPFWFKVSGKVMVHWHGSKLRKKSVTLGSKFASHRFVCTPDLIKYDPGAIWIPNPIDLTTLPQANNRANDGPLRIVHMPTSRAVKGTGHVIRAVKKLKKSGFKDIELRLIEGASHKKALEEIARADVVVDQLLIGWYGVVSVEAMALGKPVCVFVDEELLRYASDVPIVNTDPETIKEKLQYLLEDESIRRDLGARGRSFAAKKHDVVNIVKMLDKYYK